MKKYKVHFSFWNIFSETQEEIVILQNKLKLFYVALISGTWYTLDANYAMYAAILGFIGDNILACFWIEPVENQNGLPKMQNPPPPPPPPIRNNKTQQ